MKAGAALRDAIEGWQRQRKSVRKMRASDVAIVSAGKSGRTWLAVLISHVYHQRLGIDEREVIRFDNFRRLTPAAPTIFFTHDNRKDEERTPRFRASDFRGIKTILLVRDPRDTAVSSYFNNFRHPDDPRPVLHGKGIADFVIRNRLPRLISFLQRWHDQISKIERRLVVRYEDLRSRPQAELARIMQFIDNRPPVAAEIAAAVEFASFDNMKRREAANFFTTDRLRAADPAKEETFKVRRGKVGGYRDYFDADQLAAIEALMAAANLGAFGYLPAPIPSEAGPPAAGGARGPAGRDEPTPGLRPTQPAVGAI
jgi:alcohol sulfotransferase